MANRASRAGTINLEAAAGQLSDTRLQAQCRQDLPHLVWLLLLKAFQYEGHFPEHKNDLPSAVVAHVAAQVGKCLAEAACRYSGAARPHVRHVDYQGRPGEVTCILALARVRVIALAKTVRVDQGAGGVYDTRRLFMVSTTC
jgi:hypothetical protein